MFLDLWRRLGSRKPTFSGGRHRGTARHEPSYRLRLEALEDRVVPASFFVAPTGSDLNPGTAALPFRTIQQGIAAAAAAPDGDDVVNVAAGTYNTPGVDLSLSIPNSPDLTNLQLLGGWDATFSSRTPRTTVYVPQTPSNINNADVDVFANNVTMDGFTFVFDGTPGAGGIRESAGIRSQGTGLVINDNTIEVPNGNLAVPIPGAGVRTVTGTDQSGLRITNNTFQADAPNPSQPIRINPGTASDVLVSGNTITGTNLGIGIFVDTMSNVTIRQNTVVRTAAPTVVSTLIAVGPINGLADQTNVTIDQNTLDGGDPTQANTRGMILGAGTGSSFSLIGATVTNNTIRNNSLGILDANPTAVTILGGQISDNALGVLNQFPATSRLTLTAVQLTNNTIGLNLSNLVSLDLNDVTFAGNGSDGTIQDVATINFTVSGGATTFSGVIGGASALNKLGAGELTLVGDNPYSGATTVDAGTLFISGSQPSSPVTVNSGASLGGTGTTGSIVASGGGTVSPGVNGLGTLTSQAGVTFLTGSSFAVDLNGTTAGTQYDVLNAAGPVNLGSSTYGASIGGGFVPGVGETFTIIQAIGGVFGTFAQGSTITVDGQTFQIIYNPDSVVLVVLNTAPTVNPPTVSPASILEGDSVTLSGTFTDPDSLDTHTVLIDWGDGTSDTINLAAGVTSYGPVPHTYRDNPPGQPTGSFTITVTVTDSNGDSGLNTTAVQVSNVAPTGTINGAPASSPEGTPITLTATATDPSPTDTSAGFTFLWAVIKNGVPFASGSGGQLTFTPDDNGTYIASVVATDKDGGRSNPASVTIVVTNTAPANVTVSPTVNSIFENSAVTVLGSFDDPGTLDTHTVVIAWGDGSVDTVNLGANALTFGATHVYLDNGPGNAPLTITATVTDNDSDSGAGSTSVTVRNSPPAPVLHGTPPGSVSFEVTPISLTATATDPSPTDTSAGFRFAWNVTQDGTPFAVGSGARFTFTPVDSGTYVVTLRATDKDGGTGTASATITLTRPGPTTTGFVFALYRDVLRRLPDAAGYSFWVGQLRAGLLSRGQVATLFSQSVERKGIAVEQFYQQLLRRPSDAVGKAHWVQRLVSGATEAEVVLGFVTSAEFTHQFPNNPSYVAALYVRLLGRSAGPTPAELAFQTFALNTGQVNRGQLAFLFLASDEAYLRAIDDAYSYYLGRLPDALGEQGFFAQLQSGRVDPVGFQAEFLASEEYFRRNGSVF